MLQCATGRTPDDSLPLTAEVHSFLQLFSECLGIDCVSLEELHRWCCGAELGSTSAIQQAYIQLLDVPGRKKARAGEWKEAAVKFGAAQSVVPSHARYDRLSYRERALILKRLCEWNLDNNAKLRAEVKQLGPAVLRTCPLGTDMQGNQYWMLEDHTSQAILFAEKPYVGTPGEVTQCTVVAWNLDEVADVLVDLKTQMVQRLHEKPTEAASVENKHCKTSSSKLACVICAESIKRGVEVCTCRQCCRCSHTECARVVVDPSDKWTCPVCSSSQQEHLISSIQERLEHLVPNHEIYRKTMSQTEKELKRLAFFYGRTAWQNTIEECQSRLRKRRKMDYSEMETKRLSKAEEKYQIFCPKKEMSYCKRTNMRLSCAEEEYRASCHSSSSSDEQSIESGEEEVDAIIISQRSQRYQSLLDKRKAACSALNCTGGKENMQPN